jgi:catechol 2,3-dioxygenase-like lactoylglutathione lyase family enzyme
MLSEKIISGIQQIGIGVNNLKVAWNWYRENFGMDIKIFEEAAIASLMLPYTGGKPRMRRAALAMNLQGGGGFEIWQYTERTPVPPAFQVQLGDLGIYSAKIKSRNVNKTFEQFRAKELKVHELRTGPDDKQHFFLTDPFGNMFQVVECNSWFKMEKNKYTGAASGALIGVSNIDNAKKVYSDILGYDHVVFDETGVFDDLKSVPGGGRKFRRVLLEHSRPRVGLLSRLLGSSEIELFQVLDQKPSKIFMNRYWGDLGFIHLCYDIHGMDALRFECKSKGFPFTVDSDSSLKTDTFDMGEAAGHFAYIEDPDGTLIEFVETHRIPILKKFGLYLNLRRRNPAEPLPNFILKALKYSKVTAKHFK